MVAAWSFCVLSLPGSLLPLPGTGPGEKGFLVTLLKEETPPASFLPWSAGGKISFLVLKRSRAELHAATGTQPLHKRAPFVDRHCFKLLFLRMISSP